MSNGQEGFISKLQIAADKFHTVAYKQFSFYKKLYGTKVIIHRHKVSSEYVDFFGATFTSTSYNDPDIEKIPAVLLINKNDLLNIYQKNSQSIEVFDNEPTLMSGDVVIFSHNHNKFPFKVIQIDSFSTGANVIHRFTLSGMMESKDL